MQVNNVGNAIAAAYGPVPSDLCPMQVARDGEDYGIGMLAPIAMPPPQGAHRSKAPLIASMVVVSLAALSPMHGRTSGAGSMQPLMAKALRQQPQRTPPSRISTRSAPPSGRDRATTSRTSLGNTTACMLVVKRCGLGTRVCVMRFTGNLHRSEENQADEDTLCNEPLLGEVSGHRLVGVPPLRRRGELCVRLCALRRFCSRRFAWTGRGCRPAMSQRAHPHTLKIKCR